MGGTCDVLGQFPRQIWFIMGNELCERFCYYGLRAILYLYLHTQLLFSKDEATMIYHIFVFAAYSMGVPGAIVSDSKWGKFRTIWRFSSVYVVGCITLSLTAIPGFTGDSGPTWWGCFLGLLLIAVGTGGIKPNVSSFGGDQFSKSTSQSVIETFFSAFYLTVNIGSVASTFTTPLVREEYGYAAAFGVPAVLLIIAITVFLFGAHLYTRIPPAGSIVVVAVNIVRDAWKFVCCGRTRDDVEEAKNAKKSLLGKDDDDKNGVSGVGGVSGVSGVSTSTVDDDHECGEDGMGVHDDTLHDEVENIDDNEHTIVAVRDGGNIGTKKSWMKGETDGRHWIYRALLVGDWDEKTVDGVSIVVRVIRVLSPIIMFWALFDQHGSRWVAQASEMDRDLGFVQMTPDQMTMFNPALLMLLIPVFDRIIYPALRKCGLKLLALNRMKVGMVFASASFVSAGLVQMEIDSRGDDDKVHVMWQLPQYFLLSCGEILISISGLEFAYSQAPKEMKSVLQSVWLMTTALGNLIVVLVAGVSLMTSMWEYFFFAGMMFIVFLLFLVIVRGYEYVRRDETNGDDTDDKIDDDSDDANDGDGDGDVRHESGDDRAVEDVILEDGGSRAPVSYGSVTDRSEEDHTIAIGNAASPMHGDDGDDDSKKMIGEGKS
jgi:dipeptide/tripeptide permease